VLNKTDIKAFAQTGTAFLYGNLRKEPFAFVRLFQ